MRLATCRSLARLRHDCGGLTLRSRGGFTNRSRGGFTIIEVLVAMAILLFGMTAVLGLLTFGAAMSRTALLRATSAAASEAVVADLEETLFPLVGGEAGPPVEIKDRALPGNSDVIYSATAHENPANALEYRVDVDMSWQSAGVKRERRFSTILLREIPFGERMRKQFVEGVKATAKTPPILDSAPPK
jgi:prepilin-type N-terminal cleavage/methylation domain-containing protein